MGNYLRKWNSKLGVSSIKKICFEDNEGNEVPFNELFEFRASIGAGGFGFVVAALDRSTGEEIALKIIAKDDDNYDAVEHLK